MNNDTVNRSVQVPKSPVLDLQWFGQQETLLKDPASHQLASLNYLTIIRQLVANSEIPDEVEIMKEYVADPNCRTCHGKGRLGINRIPVKDGVGHFNQLQLCHCAQKKESAILRFEKTILQQFDLMQRADIQYFQVLYRHTFWGGLVYGYNRAKGTIRREWIKIEKSIKDRIAKYWFFRSSAAPATLPPQPENPAV